jgi:hypothetical protein
MTIADRMADPMDRLLTQGDPAVPMPDGLAARIKAAVPLMPQMGPEPVARIGGDAAAPATPAVAAGGSAVVTPLVRRRRYLVPLGLGALTAVAASLAAVFLSSAQGWQAPAMAPTADNGTVIAVQAPEPAAPDGPGQPAALPVRQLAAGKAASSAAAPAIRPGATPVLAQATAPAVVLPADPASVPAQELAIHGDDAPIQQLNPAEAAAIERRADRRAAREAAAEPAGAPVAMGLRGGAVVQAGATPAPR